MGLLDCVLNRSSDDEGGRPLKPNDEQRTDVLNFPVYEVTLHYRNGDTETFECYGRYGSDENRITYNVEPEGRGKLWKGDGEAGYSFDRRAVNYEVLNREPIEEKVGTEAWELSWTVTHEWERDGYGTTYSWEPKATDITLEPSN